MIVRDELERIRDEYAGRALSDLMWLKACKLHEFDVRSRKELYKAYIGDYTLDKYGSWAEALEAFIAMNWVSTAVVGSGLSEVDVIGE